MYLSTSEGTLGFLKQYVGLRLWLWYVVVVVGFGQVGSGWSAPVQRRKRLTVAVDCSCWLRMLNGGGDGDSGGGVGSQFILAVFVSHSRVVGKGPHAPVPLACDLFPLPTLYLHCAVMEGLSAGLPTHVSF